MFEPEPECEPEPEMCRGDGLLDREDFFFFFGKEGVDLFAVFVGEILDLLLELFEGVFGEVAIGFLLAGGFVSFAAHFADRDFRLFGFFLADFDDLFSGCFIHWGDADPDDFAVDDRLYAEVGFFDRFGDGAGCLGIEGSDEELSRFRGGDGCHLAQAHRRAVGFYEDSVEKGGIRTVAAEPFELCHKVGDGRFHLFFGVV